jgi:ubiquinone biosynthesis protein UbiJ
MPTTRTTRKRRTQSQHQNKDVVGRLADAGEDALHRLAELPGGQRVASGINDLRNRVDELSKKVRGIDELERRVAKLEKDVAALKKPRTKSTRASASRSSASSSS